MVDPGFALVGLAALPAFFFYFLVNLPPGLLQLLRPLLMLLCLATAMDFFNEVSLNVATQSLPAQWLFIAVMVLMLFWLVFELFIFFVGVIDLFKRATQGRDYKQ